MKFGQFIEYRKSNIFLKNHAENEIGRLVPNFLLFFKKALYEVKASGLSLVSMYFGCLQHSMQWKQAVENVGLLIKRFVNFDFSEKGLGIASPPHFMSDFSRKLFLVLYSIDWPNFIVWLPLLLTISQLLLTILQY